MASASCVVHYDSLHGVYLRHDAFMITFHVEIDIAFMVS